jgi:hypothetical protein
MPTYILLDDTCIAYFDSDCNSLDYDDADDVLDSYEQPR